MALLLFERISTLFRRKAGVQTTKCSLKASKIGTCLVTLIILMSNRMPRNKRRKIKYITGGHRPHCLGIIKP